MIVLLSLLFSAHCSRNPSLSSRFARHSPPESAEDEKRGETIRERGARVSAQRRMPFRGEKILRCYPCPGSILSQAERGSKIFWDAAQVDPHLTSRGRTGIASQPLYPGEPIVGALCPRKGHRWNGHAG